MVSFLIPHALRQYERIYKSGGDQLSEDTRWLAGHILARSLDRYKQAGLWSRQTKMIPQGFARLAQSLHSGGFIARVPSYDDCVEPTLNRI